VEQLTIPGATVRILHHAFLAEYEFGDLPVDVLLVAGLNDLLRGSSVDQLMQEIQNFKMDVLNLKRDGGKSTFGCTTLPQPPKFTTLPMEPRRSKMDMSAEAFSLIDRKLNPSTMKKSRKGTV